MMDATLRVKSDGDGDGVVLYTDDVELRLSNDDAARIALKMIGVSNGG